MKQVLPSVFSSVRCIGLQGEASQTAAASMCSQWQIVVLYIRCYLSDGCLKLLKWNKSSEANMTLNYMSKDSEGSDCLPCLQFLKRTRLKTTVDTPFTPCLCCALHVRAVHIWSGIDVIHVTKWYKLSFGANCLHLYVHKHTNGVSTDATWCGSALIMVKYNSHLE